MKALFDHAATTAGVTVRVAARFMPEQSDANGYSWTYHVRIENGRDTPVQLIARHWIITDGNGAMSEVEGEGVVGEQPVIAPGGSFDYVSGCPLPTSSGAMQGEYAMLGDDGLFEVQIPHFPLISRQYQR